MIMTSGGARAQSGIENTQVTPSTGPCSTTFTVTGDNADIGENVYVNWHTGIDTWVKVGENIADENGHFSISCTAPAQDRVGSHTLDIVGRSSHKSAGGTFYIVPKITLAENEGHFCETIGITGTGFLPDNTITISLNNENLTTVTSDENGSFNTQFHIDNAPNCDHVVKAIDTDGNENSENFKIDAWIWLDENEGHYCQNIDIHGRGFDNNATVTVILAGDNVLVTTTDDNGSFDNYFHIDNTPNGYQTVTAVDNGLKAAENSKTLKIDAWIWLDENEGHYCQNIDIHGRGFAASQTLWVYFPDLTIALTTATDDNGSFDNQFHIDNAPNGDQTVMAVDDSGNDNSKTLKIDPWIWLDENENIVGSTVGIHGRGFLADDTITVTFGSATVLTPTTDGNGSFDNTFVVPENYYGLHLVTARDTGGNENSENFKIIPWIVMTPTTVYPNLLADGSYVPPQENFTLTATGFLPTGFLPSNTVRIYFDGIDAIYTIDPNDKGSFIYTWPLNVELPAGGHVITAKDTVNSIENSDNFTVVPKIWVADNDNIWAGDNEGHYCENVWVWGRGFNENDNVTIYINGENVKWPVPTDENGSFENFFHIDNVPVGWRWVKAEDTHDNENSVQFRIWPWILLDNDNGVGGSDIGISGWGFNENASVTIYINGENIKWPVPTDENGSFDTTFHVPENALGRYIVRAVDNYGNENSKPFTAVGIRLTPNRGNVGDSIKIDGAGFTPYDDNITIWFSTSTVDIQITSLRKPIDNTYRDNILADENGCFWDWWFTVPPLSAGVHTVTAKGSPDYHENFTVDPKITLQPEWCWEHTGALVTVTGTGFGDNKLVTITIRENKENRAEYELASGFKTDNVGGFTEAVHIYGLPIGIYKVQARDNEENENFAYFTVDYWLDVTVTPNGTEYYRGDNVRFGILVNLHGSRVAATITSAQLFSPTENHSILDNVQNLENGLFGAWYSLPSDAPFGGYALRVTASYTYENVVLTGDGVGSFQVNQTAEEIHQQIENIENKVENVRNYVMHIEDNVVWIKDYLQNTVKVELDNILNYAVSIQNDTIWIKSKLDNMQIKLENIENLIVIVRDNVLWIKDYLTDNIKVELDNVLSYAVSIKGDTVWIKDYLENTIKVELDNIKAYSISIQDNVLWIKDYLTGTIKVELDNIKAYSVSILDNTLWIKDYLQNTIKVELDNILGYAVSIKGDTVWIKDYLENTIKVELDNIKAYSVSILDNTLWIKDYLQNTIKVELDNIKAYSVSILDNTLWIKERILNVVEVKLDNILAYSVRIENNTVWIENYLENIVKVELDNIKGTVISILDNVLWIKDNVLTIMVNLNTLLARTDNILGHVENILDNVLYIKTDVGTLLVNVDNLENKLDNLIGWLDSYENDILWIRTQIGTILVDVGVINATVNSINGTVASISSNVGSVLSTLSTVNARLITLDGRTATIATDLGTLEVNVDNIRLRIISIEGNIATIETTLGTIDGEIVSIDGGIATIRTDLGTVKAQVPEISSVTQETATRIWLATALVIISIIVIGLLLGLIMIRRRHKTL